LRAAPSITIACAKADVPAKRAAAARSKFFFMMKNVLMC
jgi:hypothetical protein